MTEKQERILKCGLELFAERGFDATSTSKIAQAAGVSEGLIFRHYNSKNGLLDAILAHGRAKAESLYAEILSSDKAPLEILKDILSLPFNIDASQFQFWKLVYALKWQTEQYDDANSNPLREKLVDIFSALVFEDPDAEADLVLLFIDGLATTVLLKDKHNLEEIKAAILAKYNIDSTT